MARRSVGEGRRRAPIATTTTVRVVTADRPLGAPLEFLRALWGVNHGLESASRRMKGRLGISGPERMVVRLVGRYPEISAGELARILQVHPSTLTGLLKRLVKRGVIVRRSDAGDGRKALFSLTRGGRKLDVVKTGTVEVAVGTALQSLSLRDVRIAAAVLEELQRALQSVTTSPPCGMA